MNKGTLIYLFFLLVLPISGHAVNTPCSGSKGGISHCDGAKFVCNDGTTSASTKSCSDSNVIVTSIYNVPAGNISATGGTTSKPPVKLSSYPPTITKNGDILQLDYQGFTLWLDCRERAPIKFRFNAQRDVGKLPRYDKFMNDPAVPAECQQKTTKAYGHGYDRGHQVEANVLDSDQIAIKQANYMTNILPQVAQMNRGAWRQTEVLVDCFRDIDELLVVGGVIWGTNTKDDLFVNSHGIRTPDAYWKVVVRGSGQDERAIAWIVPNSKSATTKNLDNYIVSIDDIEKATGESIPVADYAKHDKLNKSWVIPHGCHRS